MTEKEDIIKKIYFDLAGYSSKKVTLEDAKKVDKTITVKDVNEFFDKYGGEYRQPEYSESRGYIFIRKKGK